MQGMISLAVKTADWEQVEFSSICIDFRKLVTDSACAANGVK